ncbi:outer membrane protein OmpA-like peptidoglycan-associated protein [Bradyrhizobium diazoefficiens]
MRDTSFCILLAALLLLRPTVGAAQEQNPMAIQEALIWSGYYDGPLDGVLGRGTLNAIRRFQARQGQTGTGVLTGSQWSVLAARAATAKSDCEFSEIVEKRTGVRIGIPAKLVPNRQDARSGSDYISSTGDVLIAVRTYRLVDDPTSEFYSVLQVLGSSIEYKALKSDWFVIAGSVNDKKFYIRVHWRAGIAAGFYSVYEPQRADQLGAALSMISLKLAPFSAPASIVSSAPLNSILSEGPISALLSRPAPVAQSPIAASEDASKSLTRIAENDSRVVDGEDPAAGKLLLDSIQDLLAKSGARNVRYLRYLVDKKELGFRSDMPVLRVVFEERVFFNTNEDAIRSDAEPIINSVSATLRAQKGTVALFVAGHTDSRGSDDYNIELSKRRAASVARALADRGVGPALIWGVGFGKAVPLRPNTSAESMAYNRRVEFLIATQRSIVTAWIKSTKTLCEDRDPICGGPLVPTKFEATPVGGNAITITVEVPSRPSILPSSSSPISRPILPNDMQTRPSLLELELQKSTE